MANLKYIGKNILNHDLILKKGDVSGSNASTGSFGNLNISSDASITGDMVVGGTLTAQEIHTEIESASIIFTSGSTKFGDTSDDTHEFTGSILVKGNLTAENLTADSSSFSTRVTNLVSDSASFSTRITTAETELELTLISGSAQIATQISGAFDTVSSSLSSRLQIAETELENALISGSAQLASQISGAFTSGFEFDGTISGSATSTGSFGRVKASDSMGIGVSSAHGANLTIKGTGASSADHGLRIAGDTGTLIVEGGSESGISVIHGAAGSFWRMMSDGELEFGHRNNFNVGFYTNNTKRMVLNSGGNLSIGNTNNTHKLDVSGTGRFSDTLEVTSGNISGSSTSTGSFGLVLQNGSELSTFLGAAGTETLFSGSAASTGSFGSGEFAETLRVGVTTPATRFSPIHLRGAADQHSTAMATLLVEDTTSHGGIAINAPANKQTHLRFQANGTLLWQVRMPQHDGTNPDSLRFYSYTHNNDVMTLKNDGTVGIGTINPTERLDVVGNIQASGNISGSSTSTGSFGRLETAGVIIDNNNVSATSFTGIFQGALSGSAQIASNISGAFAVASASFATDITNLQTDSASFSTRVTNLKSDSGSFSTRVTNLKTDSGSFSTRVTNLKTDSGSFSTRVTNLKIDSGSFSTRVTKNEGTGSKILNGELEFTNITGSGHISMSLSSTGSFGRVSVTTLGGHSPIVIDANTTFIHSITSSAHVSSSMTSTASFGRVNVVALGGHQSLTIDPITTFTNVITASSAVQLDGKVFIQTGSIEGDLHVRTNENLMRIGKSTSGLIVSGSEQVSRFATGSDGSIIDLGFTITDEDGNVVLAGDGDGIHIDSNNYWYNNKYYKIGDGVDKFLTFDNVDLKYKGQVFASTGSFDGEMFIKSPTGSMFIGKFTGGIPSSGSANVSRFATGSDGSIIDLGFTTTNEEGETIFLSTGDGVVVDSNNYWYTTGHFKIGDANNFINWNTSNLTVSGTFTGDGSGLTGLSSFDGSAGTETLFSGSVASTGSFGIIENNTQIAGFRPIINQTADFSASLSNAGRYHIVHGNLTCSIGTDASMPVTIGAEYEFFQSSSVGKFLFQTGSGVSLLSKNDNKNIAGQHSGATLKKVAANTFHLVGDLT